MEEGRPNVRFKLRKIGKRSAQNRGVKREYDERSGHEPGAEGEAGPRSFQEGCNSNSIWRPLKQSKTVPEPQLAIHLLPAGFAFGPAYGPREQAGPIHPWDAEARRLIADIDAGRLSTHLLAAGAPLVFSEGCTSVEMVEHRKLGKERRWISHLHPTTKTLAADVAAMDVEKEKDRVYIESELLRLTSPDLELSPELLEFRRRLREFSRVNRLAPAAARRRWNRRCLEPPKPPVGVLADPPTVLDDGKGHRPDLIGTGTMLVEIAREYAANSLLSLSSNMAGGTSCRRIIPGRGEQEPLPKRAAELAKGMQSLESFADGDMNTASALARSIGEAASRRPMRARQADNPKPRGAASIPIPKDLQAFMGSAIQTSPLETAKNLPPPGTGVMMQRFENPADTGRPLILMASHKDRATERVDGFNFTLTGPGSNDQFPAVIDYGRIDEASRVVPLTAAILTQLKREGYEPKHSDQDHHHPPQNFNQQMGQRHPAHLPMSMGPSNNAPSQFQIANQANVDYSPYQGYGWHSQPWSFTPQYHPNQQHVSDGGQLQTPARMHVDADTREPPFVHPRVPWGHPPVHARDDRARR